MNGATVDATAQACAACYWIQTVSQTGSFATKQTTDAVGSVGSPIYPYMDGNPAHFYDRPSREQGYAGTFNAVTILGTADLKKQTFQAKGAMTYGYSVNKVGHVTGSAPRLATPSQAATGSLRRTTRVS